MKRAAASRAGALLGAWGVPPGPNERKACAVLRAERATREADRDGHDYEGAILALQESAE